MVVVVVVVVDDAGDSIAMALPHGVVYKVSRRLS